MSKFEVVSDSSCDIPAKMLEQHGITIVPYYVSLDGEHYLREYIDITSDRFYKALRLGNVYPKTSLPPIQDYIDVFKSVLDKGRDVLCICLTSKFSGSYQSANNAKNILQEEYPNSRMIILDSMQCTLGQGMIVLSAVKLRDKGRSLEEAAAMVQGAIDSCKLVFTVDSLEYLKRGGRIGKAAAFAGGLLNIKPVIYVKEGELIPHSKVRGRKKAIGEVIRLTADAIGDKADQYDVGVLHSECIEEVLEMKDILEKDYGFSVKLPPFTVGTTIGTHIGPTAIGIAYMNKI